MKYSATKFSTINYLLMTLDRLRIITDDYNSGISSTDLKDYIERRT